MRRRFLAVTCLALCILLAGISRPARAADDPLPSWNAGPAREHILTFLAAVTDPNSKQYVPPADRVATFDNDGTLWSEQPLYFQCLFALDRVKAMAAQHPQWKTRQPFKAVLEGDMKGLMAQGQKGLATIITATHTGMTPDQFNAMVCDWLKTARHPRFHVPYTSLVYQPMLELMTLLRAHDFKVFIVTGGDVDFVRAFSETVYGVPRENVVGSNFPYTFRESDHQLVRTASPGFVDVGPGKPIGIQLHVGRRPIMAVGNSDGDLEMLQFTAAGHGPYLGMLVHHDDATREWAYDRKGRIGQLDKALDAAVRNGWTLISMKREFKQVYPIATK